MMNSYLDQKLLLLDGGLGTTLKDAYGVTFTKETPLWSSDLLITGPETLRQVQKNFVEAGADIILTPTYQASHDGFRKTKSGITNAEIEQYLSSAVKISRSVSSGLIALSVGPYGAVLQPSQEYSGEYGDIDEARLVAFHRERISAFDLSTVDIVAFETLPRLDEIRAVKELANDSKPYWISCVFLDNNRLPDGSTVEEAITAMMAGSRPWAIGMNCIKVDRVVGLVDDFECAARKLDLVLPRLVLYPDGTNGQIYDTTKQAWVGDENDDGSWPQKICQIVQDVASRDMWEGIVVGGCCKTLPAHIKALRQHLSALKTNHD